MISIEIHGGYTGAGDMKVTFLGLNWKPAKDILYERLIENFEDLLLFFLKLLKRVHKLPSFHRAIHA